MMTLSSPPMSLSRRNARCTYLLLERVDRSVADLDGDTATGVLRVAVKELSRRVAARPREAYTRPPSRKGP